MATTRKSILTKEAIVILVCTIIIRVLSIGYVVGGFVVKFHLSFLDEEVVDVLDKINLGVLPLGSTLMFLFYSMMPFLLLYSVVGVIGLTLIYKRTKLLLIMHAILHMALTAVEIVYLSLISWIIYETYYTTEQDYALAHHAVLSQVQSGDLSYFNKLECCNVAGSQAIGGYIGGVISIYTCRFSEGCLDVIRNFTTTYGSFYITIISVNIITSLVAVVATEYIYRTVVIKTITTKELIKCSNGMFGDLHKFSLSLWRRNKIIWISGAMKIFDIIYEVALGTSVLILTFSWLRDYYLKDIIWNILKDGISMGYLEYVLTITFLCVLLVSVGLKILNFTAIHQKKKILMITYLTSEFFLLLVEIIMFIFLIYLIRMVYCCITGNEDYHCHFSNIENLCSNSEGIWNRSVREVWLSFAFMLFHIAVKISHLVMNDRIFKGMFPEEKGESGGFLYFLFLRAKLAPLAAVNIGLGVFTMVYSTIFLCGLLIVRFDQYSYSSITTTLHGIYHNGTSLNIGDIRDAAYIMMAATSSLTFLTQILLYVGLYFQFSDLFLCFFGIQFFLLLPQIISEILIGFPLRLVYCCLGGSDYSQCEFHSNKGDLNTLYSYLWVDTVREIWLFWAFTLGSFVVQIISLVLCNKLFQTTFSEAGVFTLCGRTIKQNVGRLKSKVTENPVTAIVALTVGTLIIEVGFGISVYVYYFIQVDDADVQHHAGELSRHIYNMRDLTNGVVYTLMVITLVSLIIRPILLWLILFKRKIQVSYFFVVGFTVLVIGELVMLVQSSFLLHWAQDCPDGTNWMKFCISYDAVVYTMAAVNVSFLVVHLIFNTIHILLVDRMYPLLKEDEKRRGILKICFTFVWDRIKSLFMKEKIQRFFTTIQVFSLVVEVAYGISVYALYFANFSPIDNTLQRELANFEEHRYDVQDLLNALSFTLMSFIPVMICLRVIILLTRIYKRPLFIYVIMLSIFVISIGEVVLLTQSSFLLDRAYGCFYRDSSTDSIFSLFCDTNVGFLFDLSAVLVSFLVVHIVLNGISFIILDQIYKHVEDGSGAKGAILTAFSLLFASLKKSNIIAVYFVTLLLMLLIRLLFWTGLILMGLSPGYIHTELIDELYSMYKENMNYGELVMGLLYSHMAVVPLDIACHFWEFFAVLKQSKLHLGSGFIIRILWVCSDVVCLSLSSAVLDSAHCLCGSRTGCYSSFSIDIIKKEKVCQYKDLLFGSSGIMVAYVVINFACHVLEMILIGVLINRGIPRISPTDISLENREEDNRDNSSIESIDS